MLQHGFLDDWTYSVRTLQDNVSLVTPALLQELNALLVREGHAVAGKPPGTALDGRVDSFVVETDVRALQLCQEFSAISSGSGDPPIWAGLRSARNFRASHAASRHASDSGSEARTTPIRP